jgi:NAD(P)-dependent dehydrogenase (short-subunit alcohol dehydrogenase family)
MNSHEPPDSTTIVVGASRGLGRGIATTLAQAGGGTVVAVARDQAAPIRQAASSDCG